MSGNDFTEIEATFLHHTTGAIKVADADGREHWFPKSVIRFDGDFDRVRQGTAITFEAQEWIAKREDFI
jgi:hypothetical protein